MSPHKMFLLECRSAPQNWRVSSGEATMPLVTIGLALHGQAAVCMLGDVLHVLLFHCRPIQLEMLLVGAQSTASGVHTHFSAYSSRAIDLA